MRRKDFEIAGVSEIESILNAASVCRIGFADGSESYIVPVCLAVTTK
jgi:nitroimidazol reductase NimA-like FMN-containing flavoprotein (pyridoxamine 5'-phosphate oxidase superfamily)